MNSNEYALLKAALENGIIDLSSVQSKVEIMENEKYLKMHTFEIWEGKDGKWRTYIPDVKRGRKLVKRSTRKSIENAVIEYYKSFAILPTIEKCFNDWLDEKMKYGEICKGTYDRYKVDFNRLFSKIASKDIRYFTEDDIEIFLKESIVNNKLTKKAFSNMRTLLLGIFKYAKKMKYTNLSISYVLGDLTISQKAFTPVVKNDSKEVYSEDEIPMITKYLWEHSDMLNLGILLVFETGIRLGELVSLKREDIEPDSLFIRRTEIKYKCEDNITRRTVRDYPKTEKAIRHVVLTDRAKTILKKLIRINPFGEYIFENEKTHKRILDPTFDRRIAKVCNQLGFQRKSMHKIRKTYGTTLIDGNVSTSVIMEQMGHTDIATTNKYYYYSNKAKKTKEKQVKDALYY